MNDITSSSASELSRAIAGRQLSSRELLQAFARRIETHNPTLNAVVTLDLERAERRALEADEATAHGKSWGPLHGLPVTIKDSLETEGLKTTAGFPPLADHVPARSAVAVQRAVGAGAIVFGKTNLPVLAGDWQSYNPLFGVTRNPWDPERTPGGSSGGSATSLAAGFTSFEIGSDIGGSIRVPAHWCGVYGHKPTHGIVPQRGHIPGPPGMLSEADLAVIGPLARSAEDLELLLGVMAGPLEDRARAWKLALPPPRRQHLRDYRIAAWLDDANFTVDASVAGVLGQTVAALRAAGAKVDETARPGFSLAEIVDVYLQLLYPVFLAGFPPQTFLELAELAKTFPADAADPVALMARYGTATHRDWLGAAEVREHARAAFADFFTRYDVLLLPVNQVPAIAHDHSEPFVGRTITINDVTQSYTDLFAWIAPATAALLPATSAPVGRTAGGLPVGIQIVAPYLEDRTAIDFARRLSEVIGGFTPPPLSR
ncbi:MAG: amidase [Deltaproteobacteria bacterium]|nr:amidase [Deltaproteobacteria bacterium]